MKKIVLLFVLGVLAIGVSAQVKIERNDLTSSMTVWDSLQVFNNIDLIPAELKQEDSTFCQKYDQSNKKFQVQLAKKVLTKDMGESIIDYMEKGQNFNLILGVRIGFDRKGNIRYMLMFIDMGLAELLPDERWMSLYEEILKEKIPLTNYFDFVSENDCAEITLSFGTLIKEGDVKLTELK